jgi:DNA-binding transcriptional LysR family regulator
MGQAGLGIAILPSSAVEAQPAGDLASWPIEGPDFDRKIWIVKRMGAP